MAKIVIIADKHTRDEPPFLQAAQAFYAWFLEQDFNVPENTFLDLGDHFHRARPSPLEYSIFADFLNGLKMNYKVFLRGNHDRLSPGESTSGIETNSLDPYSGYSDIALINEAALLPIGRLRCLMLPYQSGFSFKNESLDKAVFYQRLFKDEDFGGIPADAPRFAFYHFPDETQPFFGKGRGVDLSPFASAGWRLVGGDIHIQTDRYVGPPHPTRADEAGLVGRVMLIDDQTGEVEYRACPRFIDFVHVRYGERPQKIDGGITLLIVDGAPSADAAEDLYGAESVWDVRPDDFETEPDQEGKRDAPVERLSFEQHLRDFYEDRGIDADVRALIEEALSAEAR